MNEWKAWCRLCGSFEETGVADSEINEMIEQVFEVTSFVCYVNNNNVNATY